MYQVASFYQFRGLAPDELAPLTAAWRGVALRLGLVGTVLFAPEGVNAALCGAPPDVSAFVAWVAADQRFAGVRAKLSAARRPPFRRLEVRVKRWLIRFAEAGDPTSAEIRAGARLGPAALAAALQPPDVVLVDVRNDYETELGRFAGAVTLPIGRFTDFPAAFTRAFPDPGAQRIVFYCTGGIRCEKAVPWAAARGYAATQLDGGILGHFAAEGGVGYEGGCFVFDERRLVDKRLDDVAAAAVD